MISTCLLLNYLLFIGYSDQRLLSSLSQGEPFLWLDHAPPLWFKSESVMVVPPFTMSILLVAKRPVLAKR